MMYSLRFGALASATLGLVCVSACGEDEAGGAGAFGTQNADTYAVISLAFDDTGSTSYVSLVPTLGVQAKISLADATEFPGYAPVRSQSGYVFVGSGEAPTLQRFEVSDDGEWSPGVSIGFNAFSSGSLVASRFVSVTKAYMPFDKGNLILWNPEEMTIVRELGIPDGLPATSEGLPQWMGYGHAFSGRYLYQPFYYADSSYHAYAQVSKIAITDTQTDSSAGVIDAPCPHLHIVTQDDDGNVYMSNGQGSVAASALDESAPRNCMVRVKRGATTLDTAFTTTFAALTDGREGSNLYYLGDDVAFFNVYHGELDTLPTGDAAARFNAIDRSSHYHLWRLDLTTMAATMMDGVDYGGGQVTAYRIDDRTLVAIPAGDYSTTTVYEMTPTGAPVKLFDVEGWAFNLFRVR